MILHQRNSNAPKFEDRSREDTEWQEQGAREAAWKLAKNVFKLKEKNKAAFFSPSENRCLPAPNQKPEERKCVVNSGAPHSVCQRIGNILDYESPREHASSLIAGKLCDENGYSYEWIEGQKPHLIKNGIRIQCNTENFVPIVVPGLSASLSSSSHPSTSMTPSRQESNHPTSSSSSSTSLTTTVE